MKLYRENEIDEFLERRMHEFRESRRSALVMGVGFLGGSVGAVAIGLPSLESVDSVIGLALVVFGGIVAVFLGLCGALMIADFGAACRDSSWTLRHDDTGFLIRFRSFQNAHLPEDDPTIAWVPAAEIDCVTPHVREYERPSSDSTIRVREGAIDLRVKDSQSTDSLERAIDREAALPPAGGMVKTRSRHAPVSIPEPGVIRIWWSTPSHRLQPGMRRALAILAQHHTQVRPSAETAGASPATSLQHLDEDAFLEELARLIESGSTLAATTIVRERYGMDLTEARRFVDELKA